MVTCVLHHRLGQTQLNANQKPSHSHPTHTAKCQPEAIPPTANPILIYHRGQFKKKNKNATKNLIFPESLAGCLSAIVLANEMEVGGLGSLPTFKSSCKGLASVSSPFALCTFFFLGHEGGFQNGEAILWPKTRSLRLKRAEKLMAFSNCYPRPCLPISWLSGRKRKSLFG